MKVRARVAAVIDDTPVMHEGEVDLPDRADVKKLIKKADKALGLSARPFRRAFKLGYQPTVLLNGDRLDLPAGLKHRLFDGDEITILTPLTGG